MADRSSARRPWRRLLGTALALLALAAPLPRYATAEPGPAQSPGELRPALIVVPADGGQSVLVRAGGLGQLGGQVFTNLRIGPTGNKGSYTMTYSDTIESYITSVPGFTPGEIANAGLSITTTAGLDSGELVFTRALAPEGEISEVATEDGGLTLMVNNAATFSADTYIVAAPSYAPPGSPPAGRRLAGRAYSLRASGALALADQPMSLRLAYGADALTPAEQAALAIYAWDPAAQRWDAVGGTRFPSGGYVSAPITRFTFYALLTTAPYQLYLPAISR